MQVIVDPFVVLSILDHHMRRPAEAEQVRGLILGSKGKGVIRVTNFVPTMSDAAFVELTLRSCPGDTTLGFYATDPALETEVDRAPGLQLFLGVHTPSEEDASVTVSAFQLDKMSVAGHDMRAFRPVQCSVTPTSAAGSVALDTMVRQLFPAAATASDPASVSSVVTASSAEDVFAEFQQLRRNLAAAQAYCAKAAEGKVAGNPELGRKLSSTLLSDLNVLTAASASLDKDIETTTQDSLMLSYVMKLLAKKVTELRRTYHEQLDTLVSDE